MLNRRNFIQRTGASLALLLVSDFVKAGGIKSAVIQMPDAIKILSGDNYFSLQLSDKQTWNYKDVIVKLKNAKDAVAVFVHSPTLALKKVQLSWKIPAIKNGIVLGDAWERTYGDVSWQQINVTKKLPWYCIEHSDNNTICFGVKTSCGAICYWRVAANNLDLNLDTRTGGNGVQLGGRMLNAAEIVTMKNEDNENVFATVRRFCKQMCDKPKTVVQPVYG